MSGTSDDPRLAKVLAFHWTRDVIGEAIGNWTQNHAVMDPTMLAALRKYATAVATKVLDPERFVASKIPIIVEELRIKHGDTSHEFDGLWSYSLFKIAHDVGCIAYMVANNLDPQLILMNSDEGREAIQRLAGRMAETAPDKLVVIDPSVDTPQDVVNEIVLRANPPDVSHVFKKK
jgi:hypothetical protein